MTSCVTRSILILNHKSKRHNLQSDPNSFIEITEFPLHLEKTPLRKQIYNLYSLNEFCMLLGLGDDPIAQQTIDYVLLLGGYLCVGYYCPVSWYVQIPLNSLVFFYFLIDLPNYMNQLY